MATKASVPRIVQLASTISDSVAKIQDILSTQGIPSPSFDEDAPVSFPIAASDARDAVLDAAAEIYDVLLEPLNLLYKQSGHNNSVCMQTITRFGIASMIPPGGQTSFGKIAEKTGLDEQIVRRLLRHAMTMRVFCEPEAGMVAHTNVSKALADPPMNDWLRIGTEEMWPAATKTLDALQKWPGSNEPNETGFSLSNNTTESIYAIVGSTPERASRFASAMQVHATRQEYDPSHIIDNYDWASLGQAQVVDIGGAQGHVAMALARRFSNLSILVQDMDKVVENATVPDDLEGRLRFMAHDFFAPQAVPADVYYFRWILHNWSDKYCILILRAQIPVLKPGTRIVIQEMCMPEPGTAPLWKERNMRAEDLNMAAVFNSRERTVAEWKTLLAEADPRFMVKAVTEPKGSALGIIEVVWEAIQ